MVDLAISLTPQRIPSTQGATGVAPVSPGTSSTSRVYLTVSARRVGQIALKPMMCIWLVVECLDLDES